MLILALLLLSAAVQGLQLKTTADGLTLHGTVGEFYAYTDQPSGITIVSNLTIAQTFPADDHQSARIRVVAPDCMQGTETIFVIAQDLNGTKVQKSMQVMQLPRVECPTYFNGQTLIPALSTPQPLFFAEKFDPTHYQVHLKGPEACIQARVNGKAEATLRIFNDGAAGTFDLRPQEPHAFVSADSISLGRSEAKDVTLTFFPQSSGKTAVRLDVLRDGLVIGSASVCFDVSGKYQAILLAPDTIRAKSCEAKNLTVVLKNTGTETDTYHVVADASGSTEVKLKPGDQAEVTFPLDMTLLRPNENVLNVDAKSPYADVAGNVVVLVEPCTLLIQTTAVRAQIGDNLTYTIHVQNDQDTPLRNVTLTVTGIPSSWIVTTQTVTIPPHSGADLTLTITRTTGEAANPKILVWADGKLIATHDEAPIPEATSLTGRLIAGAAENGVLIALAVLLIVAAYLLASRSRRGKKPENQTDRTEATEVTHETKTEVHTTDSGAPNADDEDKSGNSGQGH